MSERDRRVHARYDGMEVVRYNRAGKWYLEPLDKSRRRQQVPISEAVHMAAWGLVNANGRLELGVPGGSTFDSRVSRAAQSAAQPKAFPGWCCG